MGDGEEHERTELHFEHVRIFVGLKGIGFDGGIKWRLLRTQRVAKGLRRGDTGIGAGGVGVREGNRVHHLPERRRLDVGRICEQIGRASGRERVWQYVVVSVVAVALKKKKNNKMTRTT